MSTSTTVSLPRMLAGILAAIGLLMLAVAPAGASEDTTTTFTLEEGGLYVTVPADAPLGEIAGSEALLGGTTATSEDEDFGNVTVTDERGELDANWTATATGTDFVHVLAEAEPEPQEMVAAGAVTYIPGDPIDIIGGTLGLVTSLSGTLDPDDGDDATVTFSGSGNNEVTWSPTLEFELGEDQVSGEYEGTITHSVS